MVVIIPVDWLKDYCDIYYKDYKELSAYLGIYDLYYYCAKFKETYEASMVLELVQENLRYKYDIKDIGNIIPNNKWWGIEKLIGEIIVRTITDKHKYIENQEWEVIDTCCVRHVSYMKIQER